MTVRARLNRRDPSVHRSWRAGRRAHAVVHREPGAGTSVRAEVARINGGEPSQDQAVYTCQCGHIFEAMVSTSVACPHCGSGQAW